MIKDVTEGIFNDLLKRSEKVLVVEWWSPGCSVCRDVAPIYEQVAEEMRDEAVFLRINTDAFGQMAARNGISGTPTFSIFCRDGKKAEIVGMTSSTLLRNTIRDTIKYKVGCPVKKRISYEMDGYG